MDAIEALLTRRSPVQLKEPAPAGAALDSILRAGIHAPDHGKLRPWRFILLKGEARSRFGEILAEALRRRETAAPAPLLEKERQKPLRAPLIVVVAASPIESRKVPDIEQILAAGAAAQNMQLAAHALGFGALWRTGAPAYDSYVKETLGLKHSDSIVGFMYLGTSAAAPPPLPEPDLAQFVRDWNG